MDYSFFIQWMKHDMDYRWIVPIFFLKLDNPAIIQVRNPWVIHGLSMDYGLDYGWM